MPGVTYERQVQFTPRGPVVLHVLRRAAARRALRAAARALQRDDPGRETVTSMQKRACRARTSPASTATSSGSTTGTRPGW